jgi:hypothetical protein
MFKVEVDFNKWIPAAEENCYTLKFTTQEIPDDLLLLIKAHKGEHGFITFSEDES